MRARILLVAALLLPGAARSGEAPARLTLDDCLRIGLERSAAALNARRDREIADTLVRQAAAEALPHLALNAAYTRLDQVQHIEFEGETIEMGQLDNYSAGAEASQLLYSSGRVRAALGAARLSEDYADWMRLEQEAALARDIRQGFHGILLARAAVRVREESVAQLEELVAQTEQKQRRGVSSEFDLLGARVRLANEQPELLRARNNQELATETFRRLLNLGEEPFDVQGELALEPVRVVPERLQTLARSRRPALRALESLVLLRDRDVTATRARMFPSLKAHAAYSGANSYGFAAFSGEWEWHWSAGASLTWDVWDGDLARAQVAEKKLLRAKAETDLEELQRAVRLQVLEACLDLKRAAETALSGEDSVALAERALAIAKVRYESGLATRLEYTDANLGLSTARLAWCQAAHDHAHALARLEFACGTPRAEFEGEEAANE